MKAGVAYSNEKEGFLSGKTAAEKAIKQGALGRPDLALAFCSGQLDHDEFFRGLQVVLGKGTPIIGGSSPGIITNDDLSYEGYPAGVAVIQSDSIRIEVSAAGNLDKNEEAAGKKLADNFLDAQEGKLFLFFYDSVKIPEKDTAPPFLNASSPIIKGLEQVLQEKVPIVGAGVVGDFQLGPTKQFCGSYVDSQSVVGALFRGDVIPYFRIMHGCTPLNGINHRITKMEGQVIYELNGKPIVQMIDELYENRDWRDQRPVQLLTIGQYQGERYEEPVEGNFVNRLITGCLPDGDGIAIFEPDFETGAEIQFMLRDTAKMVESARKNAAELMERIVADGKQAFWGLYIDCAGRAAKLSNTTSEEASEVQAVLNRYKVPLLGFYSGVEVAPLLQKSRGLDWTGVLVVFAGE